MKDTQRVSMTVKELKEYGRQYYDKMELYLNSKPEEGIYFDAPDVAPYLVQVPEREVDISIKAIAEFHEKQPKETQDAEKALKPFLEMCRPQGLTRDEGGCVSCFDLVPVIRKENALKAMEEYAQLRKGEWPSDKIFDYIYKRAGSSDEAELLTDFSNWLRAQMGGLTDGK